MVKRAVALIGSRSLALSLFLLAACAAPSAHAAGCAASEPVHVTDARGVPMTPSRLISLAEFGRGDNGSDQGVAFGLSPDGRRVALVVRRADPARNRFCQALVLLTRSRPNATNIIPLAVQPVHQPYDLRGLLTSNGMIAPNPPRWSPDGRTIAILATVNDTTQVLGITLGHHRSRFMTNAPAGVIDFAWSPDSRSLVYSTRSGLTAFRVAADREALGGYHYDERVVPLISPRPQPAASLPIAYRIVSLLAGKDRSADTQERALLTPRGSPDVPGDAVTIATGPGKVRAWLVPADPGNWLSTIRLGASVDGHAVACDAAACSGRLLNLWAVGNTFLFLRREGWGNSVSAIYQWRPGSVPDRLFETEDLLVGCGAAADVLLCGRESSLQPRRLWSYQPGTGHQTIVFDPNPGFEHVALPRVERLHWTGALDAEGFGDLVIPRGPPPANGYPTIVVQYRTRGFLRGAVGDEFPILAFAAHGFAVLSVENAPEYASLAQDPSVRTITQAVHLDTADDHERQSQNHNLIAGIAVAKTHAPLDMARIGITGISDAATSAVYALNTNHLFAAASLGSVGYDPTLLAIGGPALRKAFSSYGYPMSGPATKTFYRSLALAPNPATMTTPILFQLSGDEHLAAVTALSALQEAHAPSDAYVFAGEPHVKWQPAHRLTIYRRNLAWFDFWLRDYEDDDDAAPEELARWRALRLEMCGHLAADGAAIQLCSQASTSTNSVTRR